MGRDVYTGNTGQGIFLFNCGSVIPEPFFTDTGPRLHADEPAMRYSEPYKDSYDSFNIDMVSYEGFRETSRA